MNIITKELKAGKSSGLLTGYILDNYGEIEINRRRPALIICPGGAYRWNSVREAEPVAVRFSGLGFQTFVCTYTCAPDCEYPTELAEALLAVKTVRECAEEYHVDPDRIAIMGFSAGGHLAANVCCDYNNREALALIGGNKDEAKVNAAVLCYPVITSGEYAHRDSIKNLLGSRYNDEMLKIVSLENRVNEGNPPTFIWHTYEDGAVPVQNSLMYTMAMKEKNIPCELHIFPFGGHGLSLCNTESDGPDKNINYPEIREWPELAARFLKQVM